MCRPISTLATKASAKSNYLKRGSQGLPSRSTSTVRQLAIQPPKPIRPFWPTEITYLGYLSPLRSFKYPLPRLLDVPEASHEKVNRLLQVQFLGLFWSTVLGTTSALLAELRTSSMVSAAIWSYLLRWFS